MPRNLIIAVWVVCANALVACEADPGPMLQVDVRTDFVPREDFDAIRIEIGGGDLQVNLDQIVNPVGDYVRGQRIGSAEVVAGDVALAARLVRDGIVIASREVVARVSTASVTTVTVVITRNCGGVSCPDPGGDTSLRSCYGGRCADPRCTIETPEFCPVLCTTSAECETVGCRLGACNSGVCFSVATDVECGAGLRCGSDGSCVVVMDAGTADASLSDANSLDGLTLDGGEDAGPMDAGLDAARMDAGDDTGVIIVPCPCRDQQTCVDGACLPDRDRDGFAPPNDCDDERNTVYPGAPEICNGLDDDCNEMVDAGDAGDVCGDCTAGRWDNRTYLFCSDLSTWSGVATRCGTHGLATTSVETGAEHAFVGGAIDPRFDWWIGLNDRLVEGVFVWGNGSVGSYRNWAPGEPNNSGDEDCVLMAGLSSSLWNDRRCGDLHPYVCEEQP